MPFAKVEVAVVLRLMVLAPVPVQTRAEPLQPHPAPCEYDVPVSEVLALKGHQIGFGHLSSGFDVAAAHHTFDPKTLQPDPKRTRIS